jgi:hypothetical protein
MISLIRPIIDMFLGLAVDAVRGERTAADFRGTADAFPIVADGKRWREEKRRPLEVAGETPRLDWP